MHLAVGVALFKGYNMSEKIHATIAAVLGAATIILANYL
jgi:hypothetical protein